MPQLYNAAVNNFRSYAGGNMNLVENNLQLPWKIYYLSSSRSIRNFRSPRFNFETWATAYQDIIGMPICSKHQGTKMIENLQISGSTRDLTSCIQPVIVLIVPPGVSEHSPLLTRWRGAISARIQLCTVQRHWVGLQMQSVSCGSSRYRCYDMKGTNLGSTVVDSVGYMRVFQGYSCQVLLCLSFNGILARLLSKRWNLDDMSGLFLPVGTSMKCFPYRCPVHFHAIIIIILILINISAISLTQAWKQVLCVTKWWPRLIFGRVTIQLMHLDALVIHL